MKARVFFPQTLLALLVDVERMDFDGDELVLPESGARYEVVEGVHIVREVTTGHDPHGLCGKVKLRTELDEMGAELLSDSMIYEESGYEVVPGFLGTPIGPLAAGALSERAILTELTTDLL